VGQAPEAWLSGPVEGVLPHLVPVAHALVQVRLDLEAAAAGLTPDELWARPGGAARAAIDRALDQVRATPPASRRSVDQPLKRDSSGAPGVAVDHAAHGSHQRGEDVRVEQDHDLMSARARRMATQLGDVIGAGAEP
jgi:hypothetical protein